MLHWFIDSDNEIINRSGLLASDFDLDDAHRTWRTGPLVERRFARLGLHHNQSIV